MVQNVRVTVFTVSELLRENGIKLPPPHPLPPGCPTSRLGLNGKAISDNDYKHV